MKCWQDLISRFEKEYADRTAYRWIDENTDTVCSVKYSQYAKNIRGCAAYLEKELNGIKGKHIALLAQNSYAYLVYLVAIMFAGGVAAPLNLQKDRREILYELEQIEADVLIHDGAYFDREGALTSDISGRVLPLQYSFPEETFEDLETVDTQALALLLFTSGTTDRSKAVMISQKALFSSCPDIFERRRCELLACGLDPQKPIREFLILPFYHVAAISVLFMRMNAGDEVNICFSIKDMFKDLVRMPSESIVTVPVVAQTIHDRVMKGRMKGLESLKIIAIGGAAMGGNVIPNLLQKGYAVSCVYGMTELVVGVIINLCAVSGKFAAIGKPDTVYQLKFDNGELCMRGDAMMMGYYRNPQATAEAIDDQGWLHTGDLGRMDEDGFVYLTGRKKNLIILSSGENVSPEELENKLLQCPEELEVIAKEYQGKIAAEVYCEQNVQQTVRDFIDEVNLKLPLYKRINAVIFRDKPFERTGSGKIRREG